MFSVNLCLRITSEAALGGLQVRLSSAAVPDEKDDTTVVIGPPFYLSAKVAGFELPIQVQLLSDGLVSPLLEQ